MKLSSPRLVGTNLIPTSGSNWPSPGWISAGEDVGQRGVGPAAGAEAGAAAEHDEARPFLHGLDQEPVLLWRQVIGRQVAQDDRRCSGPARTPRRRPRPCPPGRAGGSPHLRPGCRAAADRPHQVLDKSQVKLGPWRNRTFSPPLKHRDERADLVVRDDQLAVLRGDLERESFSRRAFAGCKLAR